MTVIVSESLATLSPRVCSSVWSEQKTFNLLVAGSTPAKPVTTANDSVDECRAVDAV